MTDFLQQMADSSAARAAAAATHFPEAALDRPAFELQLSNFDLIAEIKNKSPAEGQLDSGTTDRTDRARLCAEGGAAAISVLTEPERFEGDLDHLREVVDVMSEIKIPAMRKDFLVATNQVLEAKAAGASGVLLIATILTDKQLASMLDCAFEHDLFVLLESFSEEDLQRTLKLLDQSAVGDEVARNKFLIGVNTRDLRTLEVDPNRLEAFSRALPSDVITVAESGQRNADDAARVAGWGYNMTLVGTALMRADQPQALIADMLQGGRNGVAL